MKLRILFISVAITLLTQQVHAVNEPPKTSLEITGGHVVVNDDDGDDNQAWDKDQNPIADTGLSGPNTSEKNEPKLQKFTFKAIRTTEPGTLAITALSDSHIKLWKDAGKSAEFVASSYPVTITDDTLVEFYVEGIEPTEAFDSKSFTATYSIGTAVANGEIKFGVIQADIDVDSDNSAGLTATFTDEEDEIDDKREFSKKTVHPGKILFENLTDTDADGVPDCLEGLGLANLGDNGTKTVADNLTPMQFTLSPAFTPATAIVTFDYSASVPTAGAGISASAPYQINTKGVRLWTVNGSQRTSGKSLAEGGQFIPPGTPILRSNLPADGIIYIEYVDKAPGVKSYEKKDIVFTVKDPTSSKKGKVTINSGSPKDLPSKESPDGVNVTLLPVDIKDVISDQLAGNEANKLPTSFYGDQPNNPMLIATRSGKDAHLQIVVDIPAEHAAKFRVGVRVVDNPTVILGSATTLSGGLKIPLAFTAIDGKKLYEVVIGHDKNHDGILTADEVVGTFGKTPRTDPGGGPYTGKDTTFEYLDKILIVTKNDFFAARQETEDYGDSTSFQMFRTEGAKLLKLFSTGATSITGADPTTWGFIVDASVIPSPQGLSHPLGAKWNASNQATTFKITYPTTSDLATMVVDAKGFNALVGRIIFANKAALAATATHTLQTSAPIPFTDDKIAFGDSDSMSDVHLALGKCKAVGNLLVKYRSAPGGKVEIAEVNCSGTISDLYDFAFGTKLNNPITGSPIDLTKDAARTQAGYATLASGSWPDAGRVFFTEVKFGSGWIGWNNIIY